MYVLDQRKADMILKPYYDFFVTAYKQAIEDWKKVSSQFTSLSPRTRASFINDRVKEYTRIEFPAENLYEKNGKFLLCLDNIVGRFKKLNNSFPSNIPTQEALKFESQQLELGEELAQPTLVNIGYSPNKAYTDFKFEISCIKGKEVLWNIDLAPYELSEKIVEISESDIVEEKVIKKRVHKKAQ